MEVFSTPEAEIKLSHAYRLMNEALEILDQVAEPGDVGSHLDLAICRLESQLGKDRPESSGVESLRAALEEALKDSCAEESAECPWQLHPI